MAKANVLNIDCKMHFLDASYQLDLEASELTGDPVYAWERSEKWEPILVLDLW